MRVTLQRRDDRGSLPLALLVVTIGLAMSAVMTPIVVRQVGTTRGLASRDTALNGAQAGMDVMMARVRAASDNELNGLLENLPPCTMSGDAGVPGAESLPWYVTVVYYDQDDNVLTPCPPNDVPTTAVVTSYGYGRSTGTCADGRTPAVGKACRILTATYVFTTSNTNIPGGQIKIAASSLGEQCIDAGTTAKSPAKGTLAVMKTCNGGSTQQLGYTYDLYLKLIYSESGTAPYGMCLDVLPKHSQGNGNYLQWDTCPATRTARFQWSLDGSSRFVSTDNNGKPENTCLSLDTPNGVNSKLVLGNCNSDTSKNIWRSTPGVGAGMAGDDTAQIVNYEQFSRCLDVTNQDVTSKYMIAWFCKQSPTAVVDWNQRWVHPVPSPPAISATGNILVTTDNNHSPKNTTFCLQSPLSTASNAYATVVNCTSAPARAATDVQWTVYHDTGVYASSYRILDSSGYCLTPTSQNATPKDTHSDGTSKVKVAVCNSSELQKWNAPANIKKPTPLTDLIEK
jgi:hypothetical protein